MKKNYDHVNKYFSEQSMDNWQFIRHQKVVFKRNWKQSKIPLHHPQTCEQVKKTVNIGSYK